MDSLHISYKPFKSIFIFLFRQVKYRDIDEIIKDLYMKKETEIYL